MSAPISLILCSFDPQSVIWFQRLSGLDVMRMSWGRKGAFLTNGAATKVATKNHLRLLVALTESIVSEFAKYHAHTPFLTRNEYIR